MRKYNRLVLILLAFILLSWTTLLFIFPTSPAGRGHLDGVLSNPLGKLFGGTGSRPQSSQDLVTLPPLYPAYFEYEALLPQNLPPTKSTASKKTKYIHFANHVHLLGFNNHLQELVLNAQLAHLTNRSFVIYEYVWHPAWAQGMAWSVWPEGSGDVEVVEELKDEHGEDVVRGRIVDGDGRGRIIPSRIPASVLLGGWVGGGVRMNTTALIDTDSSQQQQDLTPISRPHFEDLCPSEERLYINAADVNDALLSEYVPLAADDPRRGRRVRETSGEDHMRAWIARLQREDVRDERCVEIRRNTGQVFDYWVFGDTSLYTLWPSLRLSPVLRFWSWSPLVHGAFVRNALDLGISWPRSSVSHSSGSSQPPRSGQELRDDAPNSQTTKTSVDNRQHRETTGLGAFGERVKRAVARELGLGAISWDDAKKLQYPEYPRGYPYPPFAVNQENRTTDVGSAREIDPLLLGQQINVLPYPKSPSASSPPNSNKHDTANGTLPILALHLRRGDFAEHCNNLADWGASFMGYCALGAEKVPFVGGRKQATRETGGSVDGFVVPKVVELQSSDDDGDDEMVGGDPAAEGVVDGFDQRLVEERRAQITIMATEGTSNHPVKFNSTVTFGTLDTTPELKQVPFTVNSQDERRSVYLKRCFPTIRQIGRRVEEVVKDWAVWRFIEFVEAFEKASYDRHGEDVSDEIRRYEAALREWRSALETRLSSVYLMTNGDEMWANQVGREVGKVLGSLEVTATVEVHVEGTSRLRSGSVRSRTRTRAFSWSNPNWKAGVILGRDGSPKALSRSGDSDDWQKTVVDEDVLMIASSRNLRLTPEEKHVSQAVDMYIAQRAELFIGNGFSSLSGNVIMLRMKDGLEGVQTRLW